ncbi:NAD(P)-dependent alcohol dehydrogenase [Paramicrobacterium agarici]|uniref:alcohol dehydrogenase (NADP(+)) n=1 Tax=Paramicrobacterium agarici TaxID=630514 RepID=A0A2A9DS42_9MICO|nr:NAD(P)-dependent alcohol dehydrogenase [Microbacterium agarici]PFG29394.1 putative zinc-type alcohol dehydrogenase-like protein [Microbacterium agarici]
MRATMAYGTRNGESLTAVRIERRDLRPTDVAIEITYCGVCHSDLHALREHGRSGPADLLVPGHEFVGTVSAIGAAVRTFAIGDPVAVGNIVDSCGTCDMCRRGQENFCEEFPTTTYGGQDRRDGTTTLGGYSRDTVVDERFVYHRPEQLEAASVAPLMCAGITVWEPLRQWNIGRGSSVGVAGLGGLGHLAVKLARALGATVTVFTTSPRKAEDARALGAAEVIVSTDTEALSAVRNHFDLVIDTISAPHTVEPYLSTVALDGALCLVGHLGETNVDVLSLLIGRKSLTSAGSGGRVHTQELLDFCGEHGITADVEVLPSREVNVALGRLARNDVRYRFVLDMADLDRA